MKKIVNKLIDESVKGVDTYSHDGSTWLIFTESKQWVIELTESKTLWYNYNFFKNIFNYASMDVVDNQHYITQWVEDNIINKVKDTILEKNITEGEVEGIIEMAVKENSFSFVRMKVDSYNAIKNGVKEIQVNVTKNKMSNFVSDSLIQNGVKETSSNVMMFQSMKVEDTIQNGVIKTKGFKMRTDWSIEDTIENGVKRTYIGGEGHNPQVENTIQNGVKETQFNSYENKSWIEGVIKEGVKETHKHGGIRPSAVGDAIQNGVKETKVRKDTNIYDPFTFRSTKEIREEKINDIIDNGVKETKSIGKEAPNYPKSVINHIIKNAVKETKTPGNGDLMSTAEWMKENNSTSYPKMIDDVIENGVKEIRPSGCVDKKTGIFYYRIQEEVDDVVDNGVKEIKTPNKDGDIKSTLEWMYKNNYQDDYNGSKMINNVIENGVKETQPLPDQSGELIGYGNYYHGKEDRTKAFYNYLEETIKFGVKENLS
jgi:hypothetical protein